MSTQIIRRFTSYLAVPAVSAGILGAAAIGLAGLANADTTPSNTTGTLASVQTEDTGKKAALASVSEPTGTKANLASVSEPTGTKANLASVKPAGKKANLASVKPKAAKKA